MRGTRLAAGPARDGDGRHAVCSGADTLDTFDGRGAKSYARLGGAALALQEQVRGQSPGARVAAAAWHGYTTPKTISFSAVTTMLAERGAHALRGCVTSLRQVNDGARVSLLCHSYGTAVGFGADPTSPGCGAQVLVAGQASHTDYFPLGSPSLRNLVAIVLGDAPLVTRA